MEQAIKKAIERGWRGRGMSDDGKNYTFYSNEALLDPLFWQCLGKSLGWVDKDYPNGEMRCENKLGRCNERYCSYAGYKNPVDVWHRFIDHLAEGKDAESFFTELIK